MLFLSSIEQSTTPEPGVFQVSLLIKIYYKYEGESHIAVVFSFDTSLDVNCHFSVAAMATTCYTQLAIN